MTSEREERWWRMFTWVVAVAWAILIPTLLPPSRLEIGLGLIAGRMLAWLASNLADTVLTSF